MARPIQVPITGEVLGWAVKEGGFTVSSFAERVGADADTVRAWIAETEHPSKTAPGLVRGDLTSPKTSPRSSSTRGAHALAGGG